MIFDLARNSHFYYGWVVVAVLATISGWSLAMGIANFGVFVEPMRRDLGFGQFFFGLAFTARMITAGVTAPFLGRMLDKYGARWILVGASILAFICMFALGSISSPWQMIFVFGILGITGLSNAAEVYTAPVIARWFHSGRIRAFSMLGVGGAVALTIAFPLTQWLISNYGWDNAWRILGLIGLVLFVPLSVLFLRKQPEDLGLSPDGITSRSQKQEDTSDFDYPWTRGQALRTAAFWRIAVAYAMVFVALGSVMSFRFPHWQAQGLDSNVISYLASLEGVMTLVACLTGVGLVTKFGPARLGGAAYLLFIFSIVLIAITSNFIHVTLAVLTFGYAIPLLMIIQNIIYTNYFGRHNIGAIRGVGLGLATSAGSISAPLTGYLADVTGSFVPTWIVLACLLIIPAAMLFTSKPPKIPGGTFQKG